VKAATVHITASCTSAVRDEQLHIVRVEHVEVAGSVVGLALGARRRVPLEAPQLGGAPEDAVEQREQLVDGTFMPNLAARSHTPTLMSRGLRSEVQVPRERNPSSAYRHFLVISVVRGWAP
jgi:hypothetical protein